ncbi:MAG: 1,2-phenylacetyl-CoA epoxidase subunit PaaE [Aestuariivirgaceae bacterium]
MPRPQFHTLTVKEVRKETDAATSVAFAVPDDLAEAYRFTQGQYLTLRAEVGGHELRRPYSVCVTPDAGELRVCVKKLPGGRFSGFVNDDLKAGDSLDVMPPMGRFHAPLNGSKGKHYLFIAAGSGITPVISNIATVLAAEPSSAITLIYGNRRQRDIIFQGALADLKDRYLDRLSIFHVLSDEAAGTELFSGMLDEAKISELTAQLVGIDRLDWAFICGPGPVMDGGKAALIGAGLAEERIKIESFGDRPFASALAAPSEPVDETRAAEVEIVLRGLRSKIAVPYSGAAILDTAQSAGIDVPFSCKGGVCCTCKAKLVEGEVEMDVVYGLEPDEIEAGYILTCQSHPKTDKLIVDYDG